MYIWYKYFICKDQEKNNIRKNFLIIHFESKYEISQQKLK